jgi:acetyltransferase-like isoleucine patch superfamily enzyme
LPLEAPSGVERVALIGAGLGATQAIDIFASGPQCAVALIDEDQSRWGERVAGVPVVGGVQRLEDLFNEGCFDSALISIGTSVPARTRLREVCRDLGIRLTNAIDQTARICADVEIGEGNLVCAFCHLGVGTRVGDNNFLSAYNSFDHHNVLGNDIATGPGCKTSGLVRIGDRVRMGTGIFIEPHVEIGDGVQVASGAVIVTSVPAGHAVKRRITTTTTVPIRAAGNS